MSEIQNITILGSTGSIGVQTLEVIETSMPRANIKYLTANRNIKLLEQQAQRFKPENIVICDYDSYKEFKSLTSYKGNILFGDESVIQAASDTSNDLVISALVGFAGVEPTLAAIKNNIKVALANKETLVSAGKPIMAAAKKYNVPIIAIDSEHSAILQCLIGERNQDIEKIILTASGGPFRETPVNEFDDLTVEQALDHPNWSMGSKITIDSATMMNKGFEVIEAFWLFGLSYDQIDVLVHPQSIVHSMVQFTDGSVKAQMGLPDMRVPISYALSYPNRFINDFPRMDLAKLHSLEFYEPDPDKFRCLKLAYESIEMEGTATAVLNAANEVSVEQFLSKKIKFVDIPKVIEITLEKVSHISDPSIEEIINIDKEARELSLNICKIIK